MKGDLKTAMRAKDTPRLNVLRAIISESLNASKGPSPVRTDTQILAMLRKRKAASKTAAEEAMQAKREDLAQKQEGEIAILDEYAGEVNLMSENDVRQVVEATIGELKNGGQNVNSGLAIKKLLGSGGPLAEQSVDKAQVAAIVKKVLAAD